MPSSVTDSALVNWMLSIDVNGKDNFEFKAYEPIVATWIYGM